MNEFLNAVAMLNNMFESHDGAPVDNAVLTRRDYAYLVGVLAQGDALSTPRPEVEAKKDSERLYHVFHHFSDFKPGWTTYGGWQKKIDDAIAASLPQNDEASRR